MSLFRETRELISELLNLPGHYEVFFTGSATEIWERILQNLVSQSSHHFVNGSFSNRFYDFAQELKMSPSRSEGKAGFEFIDWSVPPEAELISVTMNETSTGYAFDHARLENLRTGNEDALISADVVSVAPSVAIDFKLVDTAYFSVQKCFGLPAGLGIWIVNDRAIDKANRKIANGESTGSYHSLKSLKKYGDKNQTPETPNVLSIYLLNHVIKDMLKRGIKTIRNETIYKSTLLYDLFEEIPILNPYIKTKENQSKTVCVSEIRSDQDRLLEHLNERGIIIGKGYGPYKDTQIRIANFPTHSKEQIEMLVDTIREFHS